MKRSTILAFALGLIVSRSAAAEPTADHLKAARELLDSVAEPSARSSDRKNFDLMKRDFDRLVAAYDVVPTPVGDKRDTQPGIDDCEKNWRNCFDDIERRLSLIIGGGAQSIDREPTKLELFRRELELFLDATMSSPTSSAP
jgi:hypothetical protein